jgi:hypothetical protein
LSRLRDFEVVGQPFVKPSQGRFDCSLGNFYAAAGRFDEAPPQPSSTSARWRDVSDTVMWYGIQYIAGSTQARISRLRLWSDDYKEVKKKEKEAFIDNFQKQQLGPGRVHIHIPNPPGYCKVKRRKSEEKREK